MNAVRPLLTMTDYLRIERDSSVKHEYVDGHIYAMAGGTPAHNGIATKIASSLDQQLRGQPCRVFNSDQRIRIRATGLSTYPDVSIICGTFEADKDDTIAANNPSVIVEVLSPSTASYDRGEKFEHYKKIDSLKAYVLVTQDEPLIEVWSRNDAGEWTVSRATRGMIAIAAIEASLVVEDVYADPLAPRS